MSVEVVRPSGTVTFLFTDVEGSTRLWEQSPAAMQEALEIHDELLRTTIDSFGGYVFTTAGDSFAAAFQRVGDAVGAAVEIQRRLTRQDWRDSVRLSVRMGLHVGEANERDDDYFGPTVNLAARVMSRAHGGQVLLSGATAGLLSGKWGLRSLGRHRVKGVAAPVELVQVLADGLETEFPELDGSELRGDVLAAGGVGELIGRSSELAELAAHLGDRRVVTLTGVGGVGKTRLAVALAESVSGWFDDGCWLVDLAPVVDPAEVPAAVLSALGLRPQPGEPAGQTIVEALRDQTRLLVLDNCEHLLGPVSDLVRSIIDRDTSVRVLATSREPLGVPGESVFPVPSLAAESDGTELFLTRCRDADPTFLVTDAVRAVVVQLCRRLDGIPLAIELAAARVRTLGPAELLDRLEDRFRLLRGSRRGVVDRHRTLLAAVEWSYQLLGEAERDLFFRLSVFPASFDLAAATAVCAEGVDELDVIDLVESLVDKSLLTSFRDERATRFRMLETLRQYGETQGDPDTAALVRDQHLAHYLAVAEDARAQFETGPGYSGGELFDTEWDNIRSAASWASMGPDLARFEQLLVAVGHYGFFSSRLHEFATILMEVTSRTDCTPTILGLAAHARAQLGELQEGLALVNRALEGDERDHGFWSLYAGSLTNWYSGNIDHGWDCTRRCLDAVRDNAPGFDLVLAIGICALVSAVAEPELASGYVAELQTLVATLDGATAAAFEAWVSGLVGMFLDHDGARSNGVLSDLRRAQSLADHPSLQYIATIALASEGAVFRQAGGLEAGPAMGSAIQRFRDESNWLHVYSSVEMAALFLAERDDLASAAVIVGYLDRNERGHAIHVAERRLLSSRLQRDYAAEAARGADMDRNDLVNFTISALGAVSSQVRHPAAQPTDRRY